MVRAHFFIFTLIVLSLFLIERNIFGVGNEFSQKDFLIESKETVELNDVIEQLADSAYSLHEKLWENIHKSEVKNSLKILEEAVQFVFYAPQEHAKLGYREELEDYIVDLKESFNKMYADKTAIDSLSFLISLFEKVSQECWTCVFREKVEPWLLSSESYFAERIEGKNSMFRGSLQESTKKASFQKTSI